MKIVLHTSFGGFCLSSGIALELIKRGSKSARKDFDRFKHRSYKEAGLDQREALEKYGLTEIDRADTVLVELIESKKFETNGLVIVEIPDKSYYVIDDCDGIETIYYSASEIFIK